jgi:hypothetical protein
VRISAARRALFAGSMVVVGWVEVRCAGHASGPRGGMREDRSA